GLPRWSFLVRRTAPTSEKVPSNDPQLGRNRCHMASARVQPAAGARRYSGTITESRAHRQGAADPAPTLLNRRWMRLNGLGEQLGRFAQLRHLRATLNPIAHGGEHLPRSHLLGDRKSTRLNSSHVKISY